MNWVEDLRFAIEQAQLEKQWAAAEDTVYTEITDEYE